ncbi:MAG: dTDP-4-dehydrorhamnose 3,5-epimerase [Candidatus Omnitrophica bacterium]|nr:dTDP-4-dehydrorhamnose 3,5-epimerase [Candidatus Omnitrophota bacterium]
MSDRFVFGQAPLSGVWIARRNIFEDARGAFGRLFCAEEFQRIGFNKPIVQINHSITPVKGTVKGLHFQHPPHAETKIITCLKGEVFDVAVDLRQGSKTFLSWYGQRLSAENHKSIIIPEGFAHGFQTLTEHCELVYLHTEFYVPKAETAFNVTDKRIGIKWPLPVTVLSERDKSNPFVPQDYGGVTL